MQQHANALKQNKMLLRALEVKEDELELILSRLRSLASLPSRQLSHSPSLSIHKTNIFQGNHNNSKTTDSFTSERDVQKR